jgi:uncharacterized protein with beta-barrel porin domain
LVSTAVAAAIAGWVQPSLAREAVALPGVVGTEGVLNGVDTAGSGTLSVGNQNINTNHDLGGAITSSAADTGIVSFSGSSTVNGFTGTTGSEFLRVDAGATGNTVNFNGAVYAQTFNVTGTGVVNFNGDVRAAPLFAADGFINLGANLTLTGAITTNTANTGTLTLNSGSNVVGAIGGSSGIKQINLVGGNASITGAVQTLGLNLGTNTLNIVGQLTTNPGGTVATTIASNTSYGNVITSNSQVNAGGITVTPTVTGVLTPGTNFTIISAPAGTIGAPVFVVNNNPRYLFSGVPTTTGDVNILLTSILPLSTFATTPGAAAVASILNINAAPGSDLLTIQNAIAALPTAASINSALAQFAPGTANLAAPLAASQTTQLFEDGWMARMAEIQSDTCLSKDTAHTETTPQKCNNQLQRASWWAKGFGSSAHQDNVSNTSGYGVKAYGAMLAYDMPLNDQTRVGFGGGYAQTTVDGNDSTGHTKIDSYQLMAYLDHTMGPMFVQGSLMAGIDKYDGSRSIAFPGIDRVANADFSGQQYTALLAAGKHFAFDQITITPLASLQLSHISVGSYQETGAGDANLRVNGQNYDFVQSGLGVKAERLIQSGGRTFAPEIHAKWTHDFKATTMHEDVAFTGGGAMFSADGIKQDRDLFTVGAGVSLLACNCTRESWTVDALYDYKWNQNNYAANQISIIARLKF